MNIKHGIYNKQLAVAIKDTLYSLHMKVHTVLKIPATSQNKDVTDMGFDMFKEAYQYFSSVFYIFPSS